MCLYILFLYLSIFFSIIILDVSIVLLVFKSLVTSFSKTFFMSSVTKITGLYLFINTFNPFI